MFTINIICFSQGTGVVTWTPDRLVNDIVGNAGDELTVVATDAQGATNLYTIPVKLCICENGGSCTYTSNMGGTQNYQVLNAL